MAPGTAVAGLAITLGGAMLQCTRLLLLLASTSASLLLHGVSSVAVRGVAAVLAVPARLSTSAIACISASSS